MQELRVIGVEDGALLVTTDDGERYRLPVDDVLQSRIRQATPIPNVERKLSPREVQAYIRGGMSAQDVASVTGVPIEYVERFEGPVLAEREFVIESALGVPVHTALETDPLAEGSTFGSAIEARLVGLGAQDERWASWKEEGTGWIVKLSFTADSIDHDARWKFDPKKSALSPLNGEAVTLSQQGDAASPLIPRLRAVGADRESDTSRFDSGAFLLDGEPLREQPRLRAAATDAGEATDASSEAQPQSHQTADLLEALRRRRGEREMANFGEDELTGSTDHPTAVRLVNVQIDETIIIEGGIDPTGSSDQRATSPQPLLGAKPGNRKGRASMPSWDDIVFGARADDDPA